MGNGFLSGKYTPMDKFQGDDVRRVITRFSPENMEANQPLLDLVHRYADRKGCTAAQISLAWVLKSGDFIVPIPGMRSESRITENLGAADIELTDEEYAALTATLNKRDTRRPRRQGHREAGNRAGQCGQVTEADKHPRKDVSGILFLLMAYLAP